MGAKYLVRLDDACPTMAKVKWADMEALLDCFSIKPIVAVIPHNEDDSLHYDQPANDFWDTVRKWQAKGWSIALHGYNHVCTTTEGGIVPLKQKSEFAGLDKELQREKIRRGINIFRSQGLEPDIWVAPSHSFDLNTLRILKEETRITIISDGIALYPFQAYDFKWLPQQMWKYRKLPWGMITICFHPSMMSVEKLNRFSADLKKARGSFISAPEVTRYSPGKTIIDHVFNSYFWFSYRKKSGGQI